MFFLNIATVQAATTTIKIYGSAGDGDVGTSPYPGTWANQHDDTVGRIADYTTDYIRVQSAAFRSSIGYLTMTRGYIVFDTSVIPDDATIIDAELNINVTDTWDHFNDQYAYINVLEGFQSATSSIVNSDIDNSATDIDISNIALDTYQTLTLNNTGLSWVNKDGYTNLCIREGHDIENIPVINNTGSWRQSMIYFSSADASGTATDPYIEVTYVTPVPVSIKIYSSAGDGDVGTSPYPGTWANQHDDTVGRIADYTSSDARVMSGAFNSSAGYQTIDRSFFSFDTSVIPDNAEILSADLNLFVTNIADQYNDSYSYISVLEGNQSSTAVVSNSDIDDCGDAVVNPTKGSNDIDVTNLNTNQYENIALNSQGLEWLSKTGYTKLCLRTGHDIENQPVINNDLSWKSTLVQYKTSEEQGVDSDPYLEVTYQ